MRKQSSLYFVQALEVGSKKTMVKTKEPLRYEWKPLIVKVCVHINKSRDKNWWAKRAADNGYELN